MPAATNHPLYKTWLNMRARCNLPSCHAFKHYGARNISVCPRWNDSFWAFAEDMGPRPTPSHSIDRIDNDGNYEPSNCRWATRTEQANNRRPREEWATNHERSSAKAHFLTFRGKTQRIGDWAREVGIHRRIIRNRIVVCGWSVEKALLAPIGRRGVKSLYQPQE